MKPQGMAPSVKIARSKFDRSHGYKTMFNSGYLIPFYCDEALPGDTHNYRANLFARLTTSIVPFMDNLKLTTFFFFVPNRLIWTNFKKFMGEQTNPGDSISYLVPTMQSPASGYAVGTLQDYMGIPTLGQVTTSKKLTHNSLHMRAYNLIYNEWFRDELLQNSVTVDVGDGPDTYSNYVILQRGKRPDYFTTCSPSPQKGTAVTMSLGTTAPVIGIGAANAVYGLTGQAVYESGTAYPAQQTYAFAKAIDPAAANTTFYIKGDGASNAVPQIYADLTNATAASINTLRQSIQLQSFLEKDNIGGTRYTEIIQSHFGVISPDARLQRSEYLGGSSTFIRVNPVAQTNSTGVTGTPQGNLAAFALAHAENHGYSKSFTEHGVILGLVHVGADLTYQQGIERMWNRQTRYDFFWPTLAHLGNQSVLNREIYAVDDSAAQDSNVFGYQERYAEYRYKPSLITGLFRSTAATTLDIWHLSQKFASLPTLGTTFIKDTPPLARVQAVASQPEFFLDVYANLISVRPIPVYGTPAQLARF